MRRSHIPFLFLFLFPLPLLGVWLSGEAILPFLEFPPRPKRVTQAETSHILVITCVILLIIACSSFLIRFFTFPQFEGRTSSTRPFPLWGWIAMACLLFFWIMAWTRFTWFEPLQHHTFTPLWLSYITMISALTYKRIGRCLFLDQPRSLLYLFPLSAGFWWVFEYLNRFVQNWFYQPLREFDGLSYFFIGSLCFSTVLPAIYATYELLMTCHRITAPFKTWITIQIPPVSETGWSFILFAGVGFVTIGLWPTILYPLLWIAPLFMLVGIQVLQGGDTILLALKKGDWRPVLTPALAGLICGFFWELWNSQSLAHWEYSIPYLQRLHIFKMPLLGYAGYIPFGMECIIFIHLALPGHFRDQQGEYAPVTNRPEA